MGVTQCGILPHQSFTYSFIAEEVGTRWYHGHSGGIRMDGVYGAFIVTPNGPSRSKPANVILGFDMVHESVYFGGGQAWAQSNPWVGGSREELKIEYRIPRFQFLPTKTKFFIVDLESNFC
mgnify:CR=1 FL=1